MQACLHSVVGHVHNAIAEYTIQFFSAFLMYATLHYKMQAHNTIHYSICVAVALVWPIRPEHFIGKRWKYNVGIGGCQTKMMKGPNLQTYFHFFLGLPSGPLKAVAVKSKLSLPMYQHFTYWLGNVDQSITGCICNNELIKSFMCKGNN